MCVPAMGSSERLFSLEIWLVRQVSCSYIYLMGKSCLWACLEATYREEIDPVVGILSNTIK